MPLILIPGSNTKTVIDPVSPQLASTYPNSVPPIPDGVSNICLFDAIDANSNFTQSGNSGRPIIPYFQTPLRSTAVKKYGTSSFDSRSGYSQIEAHPYNLLGSADFTMELFFYATGFANTPTMVLQSPGNWDLNIGAAGYGHPVMDFAMWQITASGVGRLNGGDIDFGANAVLNTWTHLALTRRGTRMFTHLNGVFKKAITLAADQRVEAPNVTAPQILIGPSQAGYIDQLILVKNARYTESVNFTPAQLK